ncbi:hypothetical protein Glove_167g113 [Diversispora epigaea]|uniref:SWIM-type domain-containing protein n=1 Tax=Diversispora epigaea TaxID=1348612 RepID=A0A397IUZ7_9GLOM|nr:hypothetical protein Glove_167g112 [Diversispora epigaea]RHZ78168.1 hypothetical protein Glove_167g113 [Diversispora epigaea]
MLITHGIVCRHFFKIFVESSNARFHLMLISNRWYKNEHYSGIVSNEEVICNNDPNHNYNDTFTNIIFTQKYTSNDHSEKCTKKAIQFAVQDGDNELIQLIREFNKKKELKKIQEESDIRQEQVLDPLKHQAKGRPPTK